MNFTEGLKATGSIVQETPQAFFDWLNSVFRFDLDVCALPENAKCEKYYTPEMDGLKQPWGGVFGAILHTEKTSSIGSKRLRKRYTKTIASLLSCSYRQEQIQSGFNSMYMARLIYGSLMAACHLEIRKAMRRFQAYWQFT